MKPTELKLELGHVNKMLPYPWGRRGPAALRPKIRIQSILPPDPGWNRPNPPDLLEKVAVQTLPRDPPVGGGTKDKIKTVL